MRRVLTGVLLVTLLCSIFGIAYLSTVPEQQVDPFTEFYILGPDGNATDYPTNVTTSEDIQVITGVTNQEHSQISYRIVVAWDDHQVHDTDVELSHGEIAELEVDLTAPDEPGEYVLRFLLYREDGPSDEPYRDVHLTVTVTDRR